MAGGKIYATPEQKAVMMEVYEADNYPEVRAGWSSSS